VAAKFLLASPSTGLWYAWVRFSSADTTAKTPCGERPTQITYKYDFLRAKTYFRKVEMLSKAFLASEVNSCGDGECACPEMVVNSQETARKEA